jgi:hypothetical protein
MDQIISEEQFHNFLGTGLRAVYYTNLDCGVCTVLKPQIEQLLASNDVPLKELLIPQLRACAAQQLIMQAPTLIIYLDAKEIMRMSGFLDLNRLKVQLDRMLS